MIEEPTRVVLADGSRFMKEVLTRVIRKSGGLNLVGEADNLSVLGDLVDQTDAEWVVLSYPPGENIPEEIDELLTAHPRVRVLLISMDGAYVCIHWLSHQEKVYPDLGLEELIAVLRQHDWKPEIT